MKDNPNLTLRIGNEVVNSYKRLNYTAWYAIAEFIDNSTQAYFNNKVEIDKSSQDKYQLKIIVRKEKVGRDFYLVIEDNSIGMNKSELVDALIVGKITSRSIGRSEFGMGMKTAAFWFGDYWEIRTKKLNEKYGIIVKINIQSVIEGKELDSEYFQDEEKEHYTRIRIKLSNQSLQTNTISKCKSFLPSFFRFDLMKNVLHLECFGDIMHWDPNDDEHAIARNMNGEEMKKEKLHFIFDKSKGIELSGWAAILENGSRKKAGFTLIQNDRVIQAFPNVYKPEGIFGEGGGRNDLINQRLFGELTLKNFIVTHTKDRVFFNDEEESKLTSYLSKELKELIEFANNKFPVGNLYEPRDSVSNVINALEKIERITEPYVRKFVEFEEVPLLDEIESYNQHTLSHYTKRLNPEYVMTVSKLSVKIYVNQDFSPNDPYVTCQPSKEFSLLILVNINHPYWETLVSEEAIYHYLINIVFDGIAEWKALSADDKVDHSTVKYLKDKLLRAKLVMT